MPKNGVALPRLVGVLITIFAVMGISISGYAYADDGSGGTDTASGSDNSGVSDSSSSSSSDSSSSSSSSTSEPSSSTYTDANMAASPPTATSNNVTATFDPANGPPSTDTNSTTDLYYTSNSNGTQTNFMNQYQHLFLFRHHLPYTTLHHLTLHHTKLTHHVISSKTGGPLQLDSLLTTTDRVGKVQVEKISNETSLSFSGQGYLTKKVISTNDLKGLSLSVWIKPDYTKGSPQFTVVSKENAFALSINNIVFPFKVAKFSIFNGIRWDTVESLTQIDDQKWNHLVATFDGKTISMYVNGILESSTPVEGIPNYSTNGILGTLPVQDISSDSNLVIGAYHDDIRGLTFQQFSGLIHDLKMYDLSLEPSSIAKIYHSNIPNT